MARRRHYHVYVIELDRRVLDEPRFVKANPGYLKVGSDSTSHSADAPSDDQSRV